MSIDISHWSTAGGDGPSRRYFSRLQVHHRDLVLVHEIDIYVALAIGGEELRFSTQFDRRIQFSRFGIDVRLERHQDAFVARDYQEASAGGIEDDAIGVWLCGDHA